MFLFFFFKKKNLYSNLLFRFLHSCKTLSLHFLLTTWYVSVVLLYLRRYFNTQRRTNPQFFFLIFPNICKCTKYFQVGRILQQIRSDVCSQVKRLLHKDSLADSIWDDWIAFPNSPQSVPLLVGSVMHQSGHFWAELTKHMLILPVWEPSLRASPDEQTPAAVSVTPTRPPHFHYTPNTPSAGGFKPQKSPHWLWQVSTAATCNHRNIHL